MSTSLGDDDDNYHNFVYTDALYSKQLHNIGSKCKLFMLLKCSR